MNDSVVVGAVLAGGESRRMGAPKEGVTLWDGRPMLAHVLDALRSVCERVAVVGACRGLTLPDDVLHILDRRPGEGPLAGLEALLSSGLATGYLVAGCDQPLLSPALLSLLIGDGASPRFFRSDEGEEHDPFPGYYPAAMLAGVQAAMDAGERSVRRFLRAGIPIDWVRLPPGCASQLRSLNTPEDVARAASERLPDTSATA